MSICKTYLFKFVLSLSLALFNSLGLLNNEKKKMYTKFFFNISQKIKKLKEIKNKQTIFALQIWSLSLVRGP